MENILDDKDHKILEILKSDSSLSTQKISRKTGIPITTVHNRIKKMVKGKIIRRYTVDVDQGKLGRKLIAFVRINVDKNYLRKENMNQIDIAKSLKKLPPVEEASVVAGDTDVILRVSVRDVDELNDFLMNRLRKIEAIINTRTTVVLKDV